MTTEERIHILTQQAARSDEMAGAHRQCLATALQLRARGGYVDPAAAERAIADGAARVVQSRAEAHRARTELAALA